MSDVKERLDVLLLNLGLADSRRVAQSLIMQGLVLVDDKPMLKSGAMVKVSSKIRLKNSAKLLRPYVSRGGEKLQAAIDHFEINCTDRVCLDVGASTGGFTDCLLQAGAKKVYAIDVGTAQLVQALRKDSRVVVHEKTNAKELSKIVFEPKADLAVIDVSFISVRKILSEIVSVLQAPFQCVVLVKPQFELSPEHVSRGGVVREESERQLAVSLVGDFAKTLGLKQQGTIPSPITGAKKGNQEYLSLFTTCDT